MLEILPESENEFLAVRAAGRLTGADYEKVLPRFDAALERHPKLEVLVLMDDDFSGWALNAAWDDLTYGLRNRRRFDRVAVAGGPAWMSWCMSAFQLLFPGEMRSYPMSEADEARRWVKQGGPTDHGLPAS
ncbi:MAG: STAS/SEC14 domain-containing protein [Hyphomicrobiaceae bacterium]